MRVIPKEGVRGLAMTTAVQSFQEYLKEGIHHTKRCPPQNPWDFLTTSISSAGSTPDILLIDTP